MKMTKKIFGTAAFLFFVGCGLNDAVDDVKSSVAMKDVEVTSDTVTFEPTLPQIDSGKSFSEYLAGGDSAVYKDPANYGVTVVHTLKAENSGENDAEFNGAHIDLAVEPEDAEKILINNDGFMVAAKQTVKDNSTVSINAKDERIACLYIFQQMAAADSLAGTVSGAALWKIGSKSGEIPFPVFSFAFPTDLPEEKREFLQGAIDAGIFNEQ